MPTARVRVDSKNGDVHNVDVFYNDFGAGRPLVAIHGWTLDHRAQQASLEPLLAGRTGWRRIYLDLPGHGRTHAPTWITSHDHMLKAVSGFLDTVIPGQRPVIAGLSYGAFLARGVVHERNDIAGVLLTVPPTVDDRLPEHRVRHLDPDFAAALRPGEEHQQDFVVWQSVHVLEEIRRRFDSGAELADRGFLERLGMEAAFGSFDVDVLSQPFAGPALIVAGRFDNWCGYRGSFRLLDDYPFATYAVLDGAGHGLTIERETVYHALVSD